MVMVMNEELKTAVERPFKIKQFTEIKPWGYELWCASSRNYAELELAIDQGQEQELRFTLDDLTFLFPAQILGVTAITPARTIFPLIVKILKADKNLSVQVHPDDAYANSIGDLFGKEEAWYVLEAARGAKIYLGFDSGDVISKEDFSEAAMTGTVLSHLHVFDARVGGTYSIPAGVIHALGAGIEVYEVSTASERTFRIYDYGSRRELQMKDAMNVLKLNEDGLGVDLKKEREILRAEREITEYLLLRGTHFTLKLLEVRCDQGGEVNVSTGTGTGTGTGTATGGMLRVLTCVDGQVTVKSRSKKYKYKNKIVLVPQDTVVVPASIDMINLKGLGKVICTDFLDLE
ncbi:MAG: hypothetical protein H0M93_03795 [Methanophagales archaeon]|nr:hypothetical protein [Methanophagales archaeon]